MKMMHGFLVLLDLMVTAHEVVQVCVVPTANTKATVAASMSAVEDLACADTSDCL